MTCKGRGGVIKIARAMQYLINTELSSHEETRFDRSDDKGLTAVWEVFSFRCASGDNVATSPDISWMGCDWGKGTGEVDAQNVSCAIDRNICEWITALKQCQRLLPP